MLGLLFAYFPQETSDQKGPSLFADLRELVLKLLSVSAVAHLESELAGAVDFQPESLAEISIACNNVISRALNNHLEIFVGTYHIR